jgi:hypothetical protein
MYQPVAYRIRIPGALDVGATEWGRGVTVTVHHREDSPPVSTLTGTMDQAALHGLLRRLYSMGLPLISVNCVECDTGGR